MEVTRTAARLGRLRSFLVVFVALSVWGAATALSQTLSLDDQAAAQIGDAVTFTLAIDYPSGQSGEISAITIDVDFDPAVLTYDASTRGSLVGNWPVFVVSSPQQGQVRVAGLTYSPGDGIQPSDSGAIVLLRFVVNATADALLTISPQDDVAAFAIRNGRFTFAPQVCRPDGDVNRDGNITAADALLAFQQALGLSQFDTCQQRIADVYPQPAAPDGNITASDALCIFEKALGLPSCLDSAVPLNEPPGVNAGADQSVDAGATVTLSGTASDPDGTIAAYLWEQTAGTTVALSGANGAAATFTAPDVSTNETLTFRLTVTDDDGAQASDEVSVTVRRVNKRPACDAGRDLFVDAGMMVILSGTASDPDGTIVSYLWEQTAGPTVALSGANGATAMFTAPEPLADITLAFRLTVTDDEGAQASDDVFVHVARVLRSERFTSISAGRSHTCGVRETGAVACWGLDDDGQSTPPRGTFSALSAGDAHTCGIRDAGALECWGLDDVGQSTPPGGTFAAVDAGDAHTCGIRDTGDLECWGLDDDGQSTPPVGAFVSVSAGRSYTCGVRDTGAAVCWGIDDYGQSSPPGGAFASVSAGDRLTCGVREATGAIVCWGDDFSAQDRPPEGVFTSVSVAVYHACGVRETGSVVCWGNGSSGQDVSPEGLFVSVSAAISHTCGLRETTGIVACWGDNGDGQAPPLAGGFLSVSAGQRHACALDAMNALACWGDDSLAQSTPPQEGVFTSVTVGGDHGCALRETGAVSCWGDDVHDQSTSPPGVFISVSAGRHHTCGVRATTGFASCWGDNTHLQSAPPPGAFTSVSAGDQHNCGVLNTSVVRCWGRDDAGQSSPLTGAFISVSAGDRHTCGIRGTGEVGCWGDDTYGQSVPSFPTSQEVNAELMQLNSDIQHLDDELAVLLATQALNHAMGIMDPALDDQIAAVHAQLAGANERRQMLQQELLPLAELVESGFRSVSAGSFHTCGIVGAGDVICWGSDADGRSTPPGGAFSSVSAAADYTCGVRDTGEIVCWGRGF